METPRSNPSLEIARDPLGLLTSNERTHVPGGRPAVFLDRDGTIIEHVHFLNNPGEVRLLPGAAEAIRRLRLAGMACVVVSNQSGVGRGIITLEQLAAIHDEMNRQLAAEQTQVDAIHFCPEAPRGDDPLVIEHIDRKPAPGMLFQAAKSLRLDLDASWMVGDMITDVMAGWHAGCRGSILVLTGKAFQPADFSNLTHLHIRDNLTEAADLILESMFQPNQTPLAKTDS